MSKNDYEVGYGKPPKHSQFPPGVSGYRGRRKKIPEAHAEIIARVRDEMIDVNGKKVSMFEVAVRAVFTKTVKMGRPRDLKALLDLLEKHGAISVADRQAEVEQGAAMAQAKILSFFQRSLDVDPADVEAVERDEQEEASIVMSCPSCGPVLRENWKNPERKARLKRYGCTGLQTQVTHAHGP